MEAKKVYLLKQDTPMIHFQHDESGATIRASELKPKLDKFIKIKCEKNGKIIPDDWYLCEKDKKGKRSNDGLDYKVSIVSNGKVVKSDSNVKEKKINSMYFGNMGGTGKPVESIFTSDATTLTIICFVKDLRDFIDGVIEEFFMVTNFGTRQDKGFGSFSIAKPKNNCLEVLNSGGYKYFYADVSGKSADEILNISQAVHAVMKGGLNRSLDRNTHRYDNNKYIKGYIQRAYLDEQGRHNIGSDKAMMKSKVLKARTRDIEEDGKYRDYIYVRALLGLAQGVEFKDDLRRGKVTISHKKKEIERYKSPITASVSGNYLIFVFDDSYKRILGEEFEFVSGKNSATIKAPDKFNPSEFIKGFIKYYNSEKAKLRNIPGPTRAGANIMLKEGGRK